MDGVVTAHEYFDGKQFVMTNFDATTSDTKGYILVSGASSPAWATDCTIAGTGATGCLGQTLFLGFEIPIGGPGPQNGYLAILIDGHRDESFLSGNDVPKSDDRRIVLNYFGADPNGTGLSPPTIFQLRGDGTTWQNVTNTSASVPMAVTITNPGLGSLNVEIRIQLTTEMVATSSKFGLGITHRRHAGSPMNIPNVMNVTPLTHRPTTWKTVELGTYNPISVEVVTYNIGQMPTFVFCTPDPFAPIRCNFFPLDDGGEGSPPDFAEVVFDKEITCLEEVWSRSDRVELIEEIDSLRAQANLDPIHVIGAPADDNPDGDWGGTVYFGQLAFELCLWIPAPVPICVDMGINQYTGMLLLSERGQLSSQIFEFGEESSGQCFGDFEPFFSGDWGNDFDCAQDKGMVWGRILTEASEITTSAPGSNLPVPSEGKDATQFIDVFCTHVDSGGELEDRAAANADFVQLKAWIDAVRATDRPAILLGDLNVNWHPTEPPNLVANGGGPAYDTMMGHLGIGALTVFDQLNTTFSDVYDIAATTSAGHRVGTHPGGTVLGDGCDADTQSRMHFAPVYDYALLLPPPSSATTFPNFAVLKDPSASVNAHFRGNHVPTPTKCMSDHSMLSATFSLAQTYEPGRYNPSRTHTVQHRVSSVVDLEEGNESDSDWRAVDHRIAVGSAPGGWPGDCNRAHSSESTCDGTCNLDWRSCTLPIAGTQFAGAYLDLNDTEGGEYHWDTSSLVTSGNHQRSPHFIFDHFLGTWVRGTDSWAVSGQTTRLDDLNVPPGNKTWSFAFTDIEGDGVIGSEETDYRARVTHILEVVEQ